MIKKRDCIEIEENQIFALYRRGKPEHIKALYEKGELYINTIDYIRTCDDNCERSDPQDGVNFREFLGDSIIKFCDIGKNIETEGFEMKAQNTAFYEDEGEKGNIYCLSGIFSEHLLGNREDITFKTSSFGESLIVIYNPKEFLERVKFALNKRGFTLLYDKIDYYDNNYTGKIGVFRKHERFKSQNEFRIYIKNKLNEPITINIGPLVDIASLEQKCLQFEYTDNKVQLFRFL